MSGRNKTLDSVMAGHETIAHGCHAMFARNSIVIEHAGLRGVPGGDEKVVTTAVNKAVLEPRYSRALKKQFSLQRKGMLQLTLYLA